MERLGVVHRLIDDIEFFDDGSLALGALASPIRDEHIPLEMVPISGAFVHNIAAEDHPLGPLYRAGFAVTVNTDGRLIPRSTMSKEFENAVVNHDMTINDLRVMTLRAVDAAFCDPATKKVVQAKVVDGFAGLDDMPRLG